MDFDFSFLTEIIALSTISTVFLIFLYRKFIRKELVPSYLIITSSLLLLGRIVFFFGVFNHNFAFTSYILIYITFLYAMFFLYLHYRTISSSENKSIIRDIILFGTLILNTGIFFLYTQDWLILTLETFLIVFFTLLIYALLLAFFIFKTCIEAHKLMKERATLLELIAIITIFISFLFYFFLFSNPIIVMIRRSISNIGQLILIINYIINKDYIFRLTFPVHDIYIINSSGILVYHQHVSTRNLPDIDETEQLVISGAIQAISMVISQTLGSKAKLKLFDTDEYKIHFSELKNESGIVAIVSSGNNYYLQKSLERFSNMISEDILENINSVVVNNQHIYQLLNNNLKKCFPYLILVEKNIDILNESKN